MVFLLFSRPFLSERSDGAAGVMVPFFFTRKGRAALPRDSLFCPALMRVALTF
jgi:hypothetical protein